MATQPPRVHVLVEGASDAAAISVLAATWGVAVHLVEMGGVTNARHHAARLRAADDPVLLGVCDLREHRFLDRVRPELDEVYVCDRDLEEELIRAVGTAGVIEVLDDLEDLGRFRTFQAQPEWRGRSLPDQLRRFAGTRSGRKAVLAGALAGRLSPATTPDVLGRLLRRCAGQSTTTAGPGG